MLICLKGQRCGDSNHLAQGHTAYKWQNQDLHLVRFQGPLSNHYVLLLADT